MTYDVLFSGAAGTLIGGVLVCWITYGLQKRLLHQQLDFQQRLLEQQLAFQKQQAEADSAQRKQIHDEMLSTFREFRNMLNTRAAQIVGRLSSREPGSE